MGKAKQLSSAWRSHSTPNRATECDLMLLPAKQCGAEENVCKALPAKERGAKEEACKAEQAKGSTSLVSLSQRPARVDQIEAALQL